MPLFSWLRNLTSTRTPRSRARRPPAAARFQPRLEALENRDLPSTYYAATASDLIQDIRTANQQGGANTIVLTAPTTSPYVMTQVDNTTDGTTALPQITSGNNLTILPSNGTTSGLLDAAKNGRLFDVAAGGSLTLQNVELEDGYVTSLGTVTQKGGAIFNQGTLVLNSVLVRNNAVVGIPGHGQDAAGGGIWSNGSLTVENGTAFQGNAATGSNDPASTLNGGNAFGGAICIAGGTANITDSSFGYGNTAKGGTGGGGNHRDGSGYGGAIYVASGTVTLSADTVGNPLGSSGISSNTAQAPSLSLLGRGYGGGLYVAGGSVTLTNDTVYYNVAGGYNGGGVAWGGGYGSYGFGGGIFIAANATVYLDSFTVAHTNYNRASGDPNIDGTYILLT